MPSYVVRSESPITIRAVERPDLPDWRPETGLPGVPDTGGPGGWPGFPERPGHPWIPSLPPREEWPPLPPGLTPGPGLPIPPTVEHPWVPVDPAPEEPEVWPPPGVVWPPLRPDLPGLPDMSGKTLVLALLYVSRHAPVYRWVVIDHDAAKSFLQRVKDWLKAHLPAGGIGGRPPSTRPPETEGRR